MSNLSQSDLILAGRFVDGDLPAHEAAQAESRIAKDADFATAVEQIRDQSALLGRLPGFTPPEDLADRTLQASMDQVKAFMGAWPIESDVEKVTVAAGSGDSTSKPFDWKSTAALIASLAGVFMIGTMLWQNSQPDSDLAMSEIPAVASSKAGLDDDSDGDFMPEQSLSQSDAIEMEASPIPATGADEIQLPMITKGAPSFGKGVPPEVAFSGTPMTSQSKTSQQAISPNALALTNASSPVSQIWCVRQDSTASKNSVSDILKLNRIAVQREEQPPAKQPSDVVEAFYVAATPTQMNLAMSQISNNADIEMIEIPSGVNSPIADAINKENMPPSFEPTQALAQQLVSNSFPRNFSPGPVPPILKSGEIDDLDVPSGGMGGMSEDDLAAPAPAARSSSARSSAGSRQATQKRNLPAGKAMVDASPVQRQTARSALPAQQLAQLNQFNDAPNQLKQYLILVRGGDERK